ncbi:RNA methyltransferase [bacterium LRH843]|nr:RNA methyltransferase [bacterium LRH843]
MKRIDSIKNEQVKSLKKLHTRKGREKAGKFLVEGYHLVEEALKAEIVIETMMITEKAAIPESWSVSDRDVIVVSDQVMKEISETETPQGIVAVCEFPSPPNVEVETGKYLLIDRVQDPGNVGTMIRTADSAGMTGVILGEGCVDMFNNKVIRASQGSIFHLPIIKGDLMSWIRRFNEVSIPVYGTALEGASVYSTIPRQSQFALIMGNEGEGVAKDLLIATDQNIYIPIFGHAESLNVAVAAGILMYYLRT